MHATVIPVMVVAGVTDMVTDADLDVFWVLVARIVTEVPVVGAVSMPPEEIVPPEVDQLTAEE